jgi:hypothetical protein
VPDAPLVYARRGRSPPRWRGASAADQPSIIPSAQKPFADGLARAGWCPPKMGTGRDGARKALCAWGRSGGNVVANSWLVLARADPRLAPRGSVPPSRPQSPRRGLLRNRAPWSLDLDVRQERLALPAVGLGCRVRFLTRRGPRSLSGAFCCLFNWRLRLGSCDFRRYRCGGRCWCRRITSLSFRVTLRSAAKPACDSRLTIHRRRPCFRGR